MNDFSYGYQPAPYTKGVDIPDGDYRVSISQVEETTSKAGAPMLKVTLIPEGYSIKLNHYIVKGEYFNSNMTKFFDCFKIPRGNFNYNAWNGRIGMAHIAKGEPNDQNKRYSELKYLMVDEDYVFSLEARSTYAESQGGDFTPRAAATKPQPSFDDGFTDDIPF